MAEQENKWKYTSEIDDDVQGKIENSDQTDGLSWTSLTGPEERKSLTWFTVLFLCTAAVACIVLLLTGDKITTGVVVFCGLVIGYFGSKKPREVLYSIDQSGFTINKKQFFFNGFKSYAIINSNNEITVALTPLKRFMPYSYLTFKRDIADKVTSYLANKLPLERVRYDPLEYLFRLIGF